MYLLWENLENVRKYKEFFKHLCSYNPDITNLTLWQISLCLIFLRIIRRLFDFLLKIEINSPYSIVCMVLYNTDSHSYAQ